MTIPTQAEIAGQLTDEIMKLIETESADYKSIHYAAECHLKRMSDATAKFVNDVAADQRNRLNNPTESPSVFQRIFPEPYDED